jgi:hypothetical protein
MRKGVSRNLASIIIAKFAQFEMILTVTGFFIVSGVGVVDRASLGLVS